jgi:hypothetical protein
VFASTCPLYAAWCSGVHPLASFASVSAPSSTNARIASTCPFMDAQWSAVLHPHPRSSTIAPAATNLRKSATSPCSAASCNVIAPPWHHTDASLLTSAQPHPKPSSHSAPSAGRGGCCSEGGFHDRMEAPHVHPLRCPASPSRPSVGLSYPASARRTAHHHATSPALTSPHARPLVSACLPTRRQPILT